MFWQKQSKYFLLWWKPPSFLFNFVVVSWIGLWGVAKKKKATIPALGHYFVLNSSQENCSELWETVANTIRHVVYFNWFNAFIQWSKYLFSLSLLCHYNRWNQIPVNSWKLTIATKNKCKYSFSFQMT